MHANAFAPVRLFTVSEFHRMAEAGIFGEDDRVELVDGRVIAIDPMGPRHAACVRTLTGLIRDRIGERPLAIDVLSPVRLSDHSEPKPDLTIGHAREDAGAAGPRGPEDILILFEVADASVMYDRKTKLPLYTRAGIAEVWIVDLIGNVVDVCWSPGKNWYANQQRFDRSGTAVSSVLPELSIPVADIFRAERRAVGSENGGDQPISRS